ncbi:hypothetical protein B0H10DRAFT_1950511 [Mycena sp. CBHHK59/15]|nr:hypothetical protein B0H10DRAFT_1950511 [Mycena sp. CBHHK59/15]
MLQSISTSSNSGTDPGNAEQLRTPAQPCAQCVKSGSVCLLRAGKSIACARCQSRKEKCEFVEIRWAGRTPKSNKGKARATTRSPSPVANADANSGGATPVPATSRMQASPEKKSGMTPDCLCFFELAQLKQVYGQLQSRYRTVRRDQRRLSEVVTRMEHVVGKVADWVMQEDIHFSIEDGLVTPADEESEFEGVDDGVEWGGIPKEDR